MIGKILKNRYRVDKFLGRGGMAEVYKVWDQQRAVYLAMKVLHADLAEDRVFIRRFEREARTLAGLQHPNIVRFYGLEQEDILAFMLMDYVEGDSLRTLIFRLNGEALPVEQIRGIMHPVCSALHFAHHNGLVHCDVKPANIMLNRFGQVYISDFGIARMTETVTTATMVGMGTPAYMAPEQAKGLDPSPQTDIYALGIILYEMLTGGERPFSGGKAQTVGSTSEKVRWEQIKLQPPSPRVYNPKLSAELEAVVLRSLQKQPTERYQTALELLNALELALGDGEAVPANLVSSASVPQQNETEQAKKLAELEARLETERKAREKLEAARKVEEEARKFAEEQAQRERTAREKLEAEKLSMQQAKIKAREEAQRRAEEDKNLKLAEEQARQEREALEKQLAGQRAHAEAESRAEEEKAGEEAERKAQKEHSEWEKAAEQTAYQEVENSENVPAAVVEDGLPAKPDTKRRIPAWLYAAGGGLIVVAILLFTFLSGGESGALAFLQSETPTVTRTSGLSLTQTQDSSQEFQLSTPASTRQFSTSTSLPTSMPSQVLPVEIGTTVPESVKKIKVGNATLLKELGRYGKGMINDIKLSEDGDTVFIITSQGIYHYDSKNLLLKNYYPMNFSIESISHDGMTGIQSISTGFNIINLLTGEILQNASVLDDSKNSFSDFVFSPDDDQILVSYDYIWESENTVQYVNNASPRIGIWEVENAYQLHKYDLKYHQGDNLSSSGNWIGLACSDGPLVRIVDTDSGWVSEILSTNKNFSEVDCSMAFSKDENFVAAAYNTGWLFLWNTSDWSLQKSIEIPSNDILSVEFLSKDHLIAVHYQDLSIVVVDYEDQALQEIFSLNLIDSTLKIVKKNSEEEILVETEFSGFIPESSISFSRSGFIALSENIWVLDALSGQYQFTPEISEVYYDDVVLSPNGRYLAYDTYNQLIILDILTGVEIARFDGRFIGGKIFSPDSNKISAWNHSTTSLVEWDIQTGEELSSTLIQIEGCQINSITGRTSCSFASLDNLQYSNLEVLVTATHGSEFLLVNLLTQRIEQTIGFSSNISIYSLSQDGSKLAAGYPSVIEVVDVKNDAAFLSIPSEDHSALKISSDGTLLWVGQSDGTLILWDISQRTEVSRFFAPGGCVSFIDYSEDGKNLITGSADGTVHYWGIIP